MYVFIYEKVLAVQVGSVVDQRFVVCASVSGGQIPNRIPNQKS